MKTSLQSRIREKSKEIEEAKNNLKNAQSIVGELHKKVTSLEKQLSDLVSQNSSSNKVRVSDHAIIRYMERKHGYNFDSFREKILTPLTLEAIKLGAKTVKVDGISFKVENNTITTCV